jgi:hypothetical protein
VKKEFNINLLKIIFVPLILTLVMAISLLGVNLFLPQSIIGLISLVLIGGALYSLLSILFVKKELIWGWCTFKKSILKK